MRPVISLKYQDKQNLPSSKMFTHVEEKDVFLYYYQLKYF